MSTEFYAVCTISGPDREEVAREVQGVIQFIANGDTEVTSSTTEVAERPVEHPDGCTCPELLQDPEHGGRRICGLCAMRYVSGDNTACSACA